MKDTPLAESDVIRSLSSSWQAVPRTGLNLLLIRVPIAAPGA